MSARILIIDDEVNIRTMMRLALEHVGYTVDAAADGQEALEKFGDGKLYDLVLLDQRMPGMTGMDVQREIRKRAPKGKIVMTTAFGTIDLAARALAAGVADFLRKPFTADTLRQSVKSALEPDDQPTSTPSDQILGFEKTAINGYRLELSSEIHDRHIGEVTCNYKVFRPEGEPVTCKVVLPGYVMELVKAYADCEYLPGQNRFWQAMCEEALANHIWQNTELPADNLLRVTELSPSLQRWVEGVLTVEADPHHAAR